LTIKSTSNTKYVEMSFLSIALNSRRARLLFTPAILLPALGTRCHTEAALLVL